MKLERIPDALLSDFNSVEFQDLFYPISFAAFFLLDLRDSGVAGLLKALSDRTGKLQQEA